MGRMRAPGLSLAALAVFVGAAVLGALVHLNVPAVRRTVLVRVNQALAAALPGRVVVERVGHLEPARVDDLDVRAYDPDGTLVLQAEGVRARLSAAALLASLVAGRDIDLSFAALSMRRADVLLDSDDTGTPRIARAFVRREEAPSTPGASRGVRVWIA